MAYQLRLRSGFHESERVWLSAGGNLRQLIDAVTPPELMNPHRQPFAGAA